ncbi:MAG: 50S ribosomal protein L23 [Gammaproteobacteria bacterium WSBS_2016_MAG_OTU1]
MNLEERLITVIIAPVVSEKSTFAAEKERTAVFRVLPDANKKEVKLAVEKMFEVSVESVRISNVRGKKVYRLGRPGQRIGWKKAFVRLAEGNDINFAELQ